MKAALLLRVVEAFSVADEETRQAIRRTVGGGRLDDAELVRVLADRDHILRRYHALSDTGRQRLFDLRAHGETRFDTAGTHGRDDLELLAAGLAAVHHDEAQGARIYLPVDVLVVMHELGDPLHSPLVAWLADLDEVELRAIADVHGIAVPGDSDDVALAAQIAAAVLQPDELEHLLDSLERPFRDLLLWLVHVEPERRLPGLQFPTLGPVPASPERVLIRLGLLFETDDTDGRLVLPSDLGDAIFLLRDRQQANDAFHAYGEIHAALRQSHVDRWPRGAGGNPLITARFRTLRAIAFGYDPEHVIDRLLIMLRVLEAETGDVGPNAAPLLDAGSTEAFARGVLRAWLHSVDDELTRALVAALGGDAELAAAELARAESLEPAAPLFLWFRLLFELKSHLCVALTALPPGNWVDLDALAAWWIALYRRSSWGRSTLWTGGTGEPLPGLPLLPQLFADDPHPRVRAALAAVCNDLLAPVGAVELDRSGSAIVVNSTTLRLLRAEDPDYDEVWHQAHDYLGDDIDYLQPLPTDPGTRIAGLAPLRWIDPTALLVPLDAHFFDLMMLARYTSPALEGDAFRFDFVPHDGSGEPVPGEEAEQLVRWLHVRCSEPPPPPARIALGLRATPSRRDETQRVAATNRHVSELVLAIEGEGAWPPSELVEELRAWGSLAVSHVLARVTAWVGRRRWDEPVLPVFCCLLGELGDETALPVLLRCIAYSENIAVEAAAAMAVARLGPRASAGLEALVSNEGAEPDKRLAACGALSAMAVLHPESMTRAVQIIERIFGQSEVEPDVATLAALYIADTGSPRFEDLATRLLESGLWDNLVASYEEAESIVRNAPSVWGHPVWAQPLTWILAAGGPVDGDWDEADEADEDEADYDDDPGPDATSDDVSARGRSRAKRRRDS